MVNFLRAVVIFGGGLVVGGGAVILLERAAFYRRMGIFMAVRAMYALCLVNAFALAYVSISIIEHWNEAITWRVFLGALIFTTKAYFFHCLRATGLEQERRILYGEYPRRDT